MPTLVVDPAQYAEAASGMSRVAEAAHSAVSSLAGELGGSSGMGGSDNAGVEWSNSYDEGAQAALKAAASAVGAAGNVALRLHATGENHSHADASATIGGGDGSLPGPPTPPTLSAPSPPSAAGGSGGGPPGWSLVEGLVGYIWPNGHQDRLHAADGAWKAAAAQLDSAAGPTSAAASAASAQKSPEAAAAAQACTDTGNHLRELSSVFTQIGSSCSEYAAHLDEAHHEILSELNSLITQTVAIEAAGAVFAVFTGGLDEIAAQAAVAARIATAAAKIRRIIEVLIEAARAVAASVGRLAGRATEVLSKLEQLKGMGVVRSAVAAAAKPAAAATRSVDGATAAFRVPEWARPELARATDSEALGSHLLSKGVPKDIADEAAASNPYARMSPNKIVDDFFNSEKKSWDYPKNDGFAGEPLKSNAIPSGTQIDRIGGPGGKFLGDAGENYSSRALAPGASGDYNVYVGTGKSVEGYEVRSGPAAEAFGQPGGANQWLVVNTLKDDAQVSVRELVRRGLVNVVPK